MKEERSARAVDDRRGLGDAESVRVRAPCRREVAKSGRRAPRGSASRTQAIADHGRSRDRAPRGCTTRLQGETNVMVPLAQGSFQEFQGI
eukprot:7841113-Pyramimonas_sp.AAC.1